jgi:hypothetical protein
MSWTGLWLKLSIQIIGRYYMDEIQFNMYKFDHSDAIDNKNYFNDMNEIMFMDVHDQHPCN